MQEAQVACLAAEGHTNLEIGAQLFISPGPRSTTCRRCSPAPHQLPPAAPALPGLTRTADRARWHRRWRRGPAGDPRWRLRQMRAPLDGEGRCVVTHLERSPVTRHMLGAGPRRGPAALGRRIHRDGRPAAADQQPVVPGLGLPRMPLRLCCERAAELTADPPPRGQQAPTAAASFVSPESATRAGPGSSTDAIATLRGRPFSRQFLACDGADL